MKKNIILSVILFFGIVLCVQSQTVIGKWKTIDDETGKAQSILEIYEKSEKIYGRVLDILDLEHRDIVCELCTGAEKNKPVVGMVVLKGLSKDGDEYSNGKILDPKTGKIYKCFITLEGKDKLKVRGYIGFSLFGRTQYWYRVKG